MKREVSVIGNGFHAKRNIYPSLKENDITINSITTRSGDYDYSSVEDMLKNDKTKNVVIVAPGETNFNIAKLCLENDRNIFVEKPLGMNKKEAKVIKKLSEKNNLIVQVGFMKRYAPIYIKVKELIDNKALGEVLSMKLDFKVSAQKFCKNHREFIYFVAIHMVDLLHHLNKEIELETVLYNSGSYFINFVAANNAIISLHLENNSAWTKESENIEVTFSDGYIKSKELEYLEIHKSKEITDPYKTLSEESTIFTPNYSFASGTARDLYLRGFIGELDHFISNDINQADENLEVTSICEDILKKLD